MPVNVTFFLFFYSRGSRADPGALCTSPAAPAVICVCGCVDVTSSHIIAPAAEYNTEPPQQSPSTASLVLTESRKRKRQTTTEDNHRMFASFSPELAADCDYINAIADKVTTITDEDRDPKPINITNLYHNLIVCIHILRNKETS
ncbi:hypothetical protein N7447_003070 [Penicillium robsamsonii]|uniref:uncharacterized protein n=1 Tax=Penicillium robsamsonii TaxID=1792511 RepID=UPI0025466B5F|nr:uncharacterized protein N7447_003070 [Penicillium robsamsonii]KAJ5837044.1 hypothetical protein N7447_003070 [Penicillium robsamsonii]